MEATVEAKNNRRWRVAFDLHVSPEKARVTVDISLIPAGGVRQVQLDQVKQGWKAAIEEVWSGRFAVARGDEPPLPIKVAASFLGPEVHQRVLVRDTSPASDQLHWSIRADGPTVAHEFGHMLGAYDEYPGGGTDPEGDPPKDADSIMRGSPSEGKAYPRHFRLVLKALGAQWGNQDLTLVELPRPETGARSTSRRSP